MYNNEILNKIKQISDDTSNLLNQDTAMDSIDNTIEKCERAIKLCDDLIEIINDEIITRQGTML